MTPVATTLRSSLEYEPRELQFGTSGRRGEIRYLTQLEIYINALGELRYLQSLAPDQGGIVAGDVVFFGCDLRPSSCSLDPETGRGEIAQAIVQAIRDAGMRPVNLGAIPTPALTLYGLSRGRASIMITGSHIPFDRNGYKLNTSQGELLKEHEIPVNAAVRIVRSEIYDQPFEGSLFDAKGMLAAGSCALPAPANDGAREYVRRYVEFFRGCSLTGWRVLVYQHSAVGRDLLVEVLQKFGAEVITAGRSDTFVPIDTENIGAAQLGAIQQLAGGHGHLDAVVSTDGDSDRPLILGVEKDGRLRFFGGDLVGIIVAEYLHADAVVVPISCNDSIDRSSLASILEPKTRIGSPYVIAGMERARARGCSVVCGWEANGGFLLGSDIKRNGKVLRALPTRDALLPILCTLFSARDRGVTLSQLFDRVLSRYSRAALLPDFPRADAMKILGALTPFPEIGEAIFDPDQTLALDEACRPVSISTAQCRSLDTVRQQLEKFFGPAVARVNYTDGVRVTFRNGEVAHVRPSGNADELRIYAVADSQERADEIALCGVRVPDGTLLRMRAAFVG